MSLDCISIDIILKKKVETQNQTYTKTDPWNTWRKCKINKHKFKSEQDTYRQPELSQWEEGRIGETARNQ